ncbi:MAG: HD domain-containing phosphohydrolase [Gemmatimonadota bacterium]
MSTTEQAAADLNLREQLEQARSELRELNKIGMALMSERDPEKLLGLILTQARRLTTSDAGSLYLVETDEEGNERLHFLRSQNDTLPDLPSPDFTLPLDETSIAGYVASSGEPLVLDDVYHIPSDFPFGFNREAFDEKFGYRAKSMLVVPMVDHKDRVVGVLQLINRKSDPEAAIRTEEDADRWVLPYTQREVDIVHSLAGQAAVSIENGQLYQDIENLFAGFIKAAVTAIDRRDPATSGHSVRVTELTCDVAELMNEQSEGPFADVHFSDEELKQLRYAGLLHDFGKVGVREEVLVKVRKLPPVMEARVEARFELIKKTLEADAERARARALAEHGPEEAKPVLEEIAAKLAEDLERVDRYLEAVREANIPRVLDEEAAGILQEIAAQTFVTPEGEDQPYLTPEELHYLSIKRGNLDEAERKQIESHVIHSYDFLLNIPWTEELSRIAEIVRGHHEKLNGKGYPDGVTGDRLPLETRIMTVCDIFDALTASDRPYKKAMPVEKALQILQWEAEEGALDPDIVKLFTESQVYRKVLERDWREF